MNPFPLIPLPHAWQQLHWGTGTLLEIHRSSAMVFSLAMAVLGTLLLMLWVGIASRVDSYAREHVQGAFATYALAAVFLIFGAYAVAAFVIGLACYAVYAIIRGAQIAFRTESSPPHTLS